MLTALLGAAVLIMKRWPTLPFARLLHRALVEDPLELAERLERKHLVLLGLLLFGGQAIALFGPELTLVYAVDVSLYVEAAAATTLAAAASRLRYGWRAFRRAVSICMLRFRPRSRVRRTKKPAELRQNEPSTDDERPWSGFARAS